MVCDEIEPLIENGGVIVDYHGADFFPERWFDVVVLLRTDNSVLYKRLQARGYSEKKLADNIEAEIMQVILDEARDAYQSDVVVEMMSNNIEELEGNANRIVSLGSEKLQTHN